MKDLQKILLKKSLLLEDIFNILKSDISPLEKQIQIEELINTPITYEKYKRILKSDMYILKFENIKKMINNINFNEIFGKTFFKKLFQIIDQSIFVNVIIMNFILRLVLDRNLQTLSISTLSLKFIECIDDYIENNNIKKYELEDTEFKEKISAYTLEALKEYIIIKYSVITESYEVYDFEQEIYSSIESDENSYLFFKKDNWPLLVEPKPYDSNTYLGGYHSINKDIRILNKYSKDIIINEKGFKLINDFQKFKFKLNVNKNIKILLKEYQNYIYDKIKKIITKRKTLTKAYKKLLELEENYEKLYLLIQYFMLVDSNNIDIYYTYHVDFRGRIYNSIFYGLNPTTNKLCRLLLTSGMYDLTEKAKENLKLYIFAKLKLTNDQDFQNRIKETKLKIENNFQDIDFEKIETYILLIDWITNVEPYNKSEILVELDASQSGFQMLSMFSNDINGLKDTNILTNEKTDLYNKIFDKLVTKIKNNTLTFKLKPKKYYRDKIIYDIKESTFKLVEDCLEIINRKYIKKIIMTIPYGSTVYGQKDMFLEVFNEEFGLLHLFKKNTIPLILKSKILNGQDTINQLTELLNKIDNGTYKVNGENDVYYAFNDIMLAQNVLEIDLKENFIPALLMEIKTIIQEEYFTIINFVKELKDNIRNKKDSYRTFSTEYYTFSLIYYEESNYTYTAYNTKYKYYKINKNKIDNRKITQGAVANICHGLGDSFILYKIIENLINQNIQCYTIHDALLCKSTDVEQVKEVVKLSYQYVYEYVIDNNIFKFYNYIGKFKFESENIFKIK